MQQGDRKINLFLFFCIVLTNGTIALGFVLNSSTNTKRIDSGINFTLIKHLQAYSSNSNFLERHEQKSVSQSAWKSPKATEMNSICRVGGKVMVSLFTLLSPTFTTIVSPETPSSALITLNDRNEKFSSKNFIVNAIEQVAVFNELEQNSIDPSISEPDITNTVWLEFTQGDKKLGRVEISLYGKVLPKTSENFESLVTSGKFKGSSIYRVIDGFSVQGGDTERNVAGGRRGEGKSSFDNGEPFVRENFAIKHSVKGIISMVNDRKLRNDSRFFITTKDDAGWADGRYVGFGRVTKGMDIIWKIESTAVRQPSNAPTVDVIITDCGLVD